MTMHAHLHHFSKHTRRRIAVALLGGALLLGNAWPARGSAPDGLTRLEVSKQDRLQQLQQAQVFIGQEISTLDLRTGPVNGLGFDPAAGVRCDYHTPGIRMGGATPKFLCRIGETVVKIKYVPSAQYGTAGEGGRSVDREIYAEMAGTRLFWALGFGADRVFLSQVTCLGCPASPHDGPDAREQRTGAYRKVARPIGVALIEQRFEGATITAGGKEGWTWSELHQHAGLARPVREQAEALELLQVFVQHGDCKPEQQRLVCLPGSARPREPRAEARAGNKNSAEADDEEKRGPEYSCQAPFALVDDLGATFGGAGAFTGPGAKMSLSNWAKKPVFDPVTYRETGGVCRGVLTPSMSCSGGIDNPVITEAGRRFLLNRLLSLSDVQIHDLFAAARVADLCENDTECGVAAWVAVFKDKVRQVAAHPCRAPLPNVY
jgi:hypothetical protein